MKLDNLDLYDFFIEKGITHLHHANSVATSSTFIENGGLLSRGDVAKNNLVQTLQDSDYEDQKFDVWNDIFLDTADLHGYFPRQNLYGPVLFKFNIDFIPQQNLDIWITKENPMFWQDNMPSADKYFQNVTELKTHWDEIPRQKKMITIRKPGFPILFPYLEKIIIDDPQIKIYGDIHVFNTMVNAFDALTTGNTDLRSKFEIRQCRNCYCHSNYLKQVPTVQAARLFLPKYHEYFPDKNT